MPKVGGKHYSYDAKGVAQAKAASQRSGQPMTNTRKKKGGGAKGFNGTPKPQTRRADEASRHRFLARCD